MKKKKLFLRVGAKAAMAGPKKEEQWRERRLRFLAGEGLLGCAIRGVDGRSSSIGARGWREALMGGGR